MLISFKPYKKMDWVKYFTNKFLIIVGSFICAFATVLFQQKLNIVVGGLSGIGLIVDYFVHIEGFPLIDIIVWAAEALFWILGLIFLGKDFAYKTLIGSIAYPAFLTLLTRTNMLDSLATQIAGDGSISNVLICSIFTGLLLGAGLALTIYGGGSTGGFDTLILMNEKYFHIHTFITSIAIDGTIILISMFAIKDHIVTGLCGILGALIVAVFIELVTIIKQSSYQADIISDQWEKISKYVQNDLGRGATIIHVNGGYQNDPRIMLRVVIDKKQLDDLRIYIAQVDPKAFVTFTQTNAVYGEGFSMHRKKK